MGQKNIFCLQPKNLVLKFLYKGGDKVTDEERVATIDLIHGTSPEEDVIFALNYLLNLPDEELPLFDTEAKL